MLFKLFDFSLYCNFKFIIKKKYYNFNNFFVLTFFLIVHNLFTVGCATTGFRLKNAQEKTLYYWDETDFVSPSLIELEQTTNGGIFWKPFLITNPEMRKIDENQLFAGMIDEKKGAKFFYYSESGKCFIKNIEDKITRTVNIKANVKELTNQNLFFLLNQNKSIVIGFGKLDKDGNAECQLPDEIVYLTYSFGKDRKQIAIPPESQTAELIFTAKNATINFLNLKKDKVSFLKPGDMIRIGRKGGWSYKTEEELERILNYHFEEDLYESADSLSQSIGVDEILKTSFYLGGPVSLELTPGTYTFVAFRHQKPLCVSKINLTQGSIKDFECITSGSDLNLTYLKTIDKKNTSSLLKETSSLFTYELEYANHEADFLSSPQAINYLQQKPYYSYLLAEKKSPELNNFTLLNFEELRNSTSQIKQTLSSLPSNKLFVPLRIQSKKYLIEGGPSIYGGTFATVISDNLRSFDSLSFNNFSDQSVIASNGATLELLDPQPEKMNGKILKLYQGQKLRIQLNLPLGNTTEIVELIVNRKVYKRWRIDRKNPLEEGSFVIEEKLNLKDTPLCVSIIAFGEDYISRLFSPLSQMKPLTVTREYLVGLEDFPESVYEKGLCDLNTM